MKSKNLILVTTLVSIVLWGIWAFIINYSSENVALAWRTAIAQGIYSGLMTLYMSACVIFIAQRTYGWRFPWLWPPMGTVIHTTAILAFVHYLNGTPRLWQTISLPFLVATAYCSLLTKTVNAKGSS